jgi:hypothetical protein
MGHVAQMGENMYKLLVRKLEGRRPYEDQDIDGWIILRWILEIWDGIVWTGLIWLRIGTGG